MHIGLCFIENYIVCYLKTYKIFMHQILHSMVYLINMKSLTSIKLYKINLLVSKIICTC